MNNYIIYCILHAFFLSVVCRFGNKRVHVYGVDHTPACTNISVTRMPTRDLFVVANLFV